MNRHGKKNKKQIENRFLTRRQFLVGSGQFCLALPPLLSLMPSQLYAQVTANKVVRYIGCVGMLGIDYHQWTPAEQTDLTMVSGQNSIGYKPLANFPGQFSRVVDTSFNDLYPYMNIISGLSLTGGNYQGHNLSVLSGTHSGYREPIYGKSIDVILEQSAEVYQPSQAVYRKAIRMYDEPNARGYSFDRVNGARVVTSQLQGDLALFNSLMGGLSSGGAVAGPSQSKTNKELVVDRVYSDLKTLENHSRISKSDKELLDRYISSLSDLQKKIKSGVTHDPVCIKPSPAIQASKNGNLYSFPYDSGSGWGITNVSAMYNNYIEMFKIAAMCDQTRVFHWSLTEWDRAVVAGGSAGGLHHEAPSSDIQADRQKYFIKKMGDLARAFRDTPDPINGGNLLDNSIIFYANELGAWTTSHNTLNMPTITFGGGGGKLSTGNFIDCRQRPLKNVKGYYIGRPYKQFLQAVMSSMGVSKAEYMKYGDGKGFGEFNEGINQFGLNMTTAFSDYKNEHNNPLPFFYKG